MEENTNKFLEYYNGKKLIGEDFNLSEIREWYMDESEAYANLGAKNRDSYKYVYHELNWHHFYSYLSDRNFKHALGFGSAYGDELEPIINRIERLTIIESSEKLRSKTIGTLNVDYKIPNESGIIDFEDSTFDLITCFGVLHHIPNVSFVVQEMGRVLKNGGYLLLREPIVNMGDWRKSRKGLTSRERGIPEIIMQEILTKAGFKIEIKSYCDFAPIPKLAKILRIPAVYNSRLIARLDSIASRFFIWNIRYNRNSKLHNIAPSSIAWVCRMGVK